MREINKLRKEIDKIDSNILRLLTSRAFAVKKIRKIKLAAGIQVRDKKREAQILKQINGDAKKLKLRVKYVESIFSIILRESLRRKKDK